MKKVFFNVGSEIQLVKGCPTDWNGDHHNNDDYNHDGHTDQDDQDFYDGWQDGYYSGNGNQEDDDADHSDAYNAGQQAGHEVGNQDNTPGNDGPHDILDFDYKGYY